MSARAWLKPPRSLLVILFLLTLVSISAVAWFGYRLLAQDSVVEEQRTQEHLEQTADRIVVTLRGLLADAGERLGSDDRTSRLGPVFLVTPTSLAALPPTRLLYRAFAPADPEAPASTFAAAEALEFQQDQPEAAIDAFARLTASGDPAIRAGAYLRLARVFRKLGRTADAMEADRQLSMIPDVRVAGAPAELVGRLALADTAALRDDLLRGRWPLSRGQFEFYWSQVDAGHPAPSMDAELTRAALLAWNNRTREPAARGQTTVWMDDRPHFLLWRATPDGRSILVTTPGALLGSSAATDTGIALVDSEGRTLAGTRDGAGRAAIRTAAESHLPWTLYATRPAGYHDPGVMARQRFLLFGMAIMVVFLLAGTYFIARVIRRETAVSRLQSDFVSAVSHEFRSPLTSMRQLSEMLALGRAPSDRRQRYYDTLVNETERLQRLVEKLLNFGGMEAGKRQYHFESLDTAPLVEHVAHEFERQIAASGRLIELHGEPTGCRIEADREALSIALRNLVDNALKYSPDQPAVWVEWERENETVAIRVRDKGPGIPAAERKQIFHKFVRGSAAASGAVKGMGVGLAMVHHIVTAHGGEIRVASEPGQGSTFTVLLPVSRQ
jgi:signal transduction histidine kinase